MINVNVTREEVANCRTKIENAMLPNNTVLDESIASVVWFGSRGKGEISYGSIEKKLEQE